MKLLVMSHSAERTGAPISALLLARAWRGMGVDVRVLLRRGGALLEDYEAAVKTHVFRPKPHFSIADSLWLSGSYDPILAAKCIRNPDRPYCMSWAEKRDAYDLGRELKEWGAQVIYANTSHCGDMIEQMQLSLPYLTHVREMAVSLRGLDHRRRSFLLDGAHPVLAVSDRGKRDLINFGVPPSRISVEQPAVEMVSLVKLDAQRKWVEGELGIGAETQLVVSAGTLDRRKGPDLLIDVVRAVSDASEAGRRLLFVWLGGGEWLEKCRAEVATLGLEKRLHFVGEVDDVAPYLRRASLLVCPSREDPYPRVLIEAAAVGTHSVSFANTGGSEEFVRDFQAGWVVQPFDTGQMADDIANWLERPHKTDASLISRVSAARSVDASARRILSRLSTLVYSQEGKKV